MATEAKPKDVIVYADENGWEPFTEWLYALRDIMDANAFLPVWHGWSMAITEIVSPSARD